ncbi:helix-turn-helix transcriptional regulator [Zavarzinia aquatilis]|uniref:helix-turn-helix transcriptional regulator n=1 Tax=Zavarzinia aquatilis TaxID=2211142 RepID=UPI001057A42B|nr:hypothetical protein [Zavarzinia aquatilis]
MQPAALTAAAQAGRLMTAAEVAALLGHALGWFYRERRRLEAAGFPPEVRGLRNRWDRAAIEAWLDGQLPARQAPPAAHGDADPELAQWAAILDGRAAGTHKER